MASDDDPHGVRRELSPDSHPSRRPKRIQERVELPNSVKNVGSDEIPLFSSDLYKAIVRNDLFRLPSFHRRRSVEFFMRGKLERGKRLIFHTPICDGNAAATSLQAPYLVLQVNP